jgi:hypothetical protein
MKRTSQNRWIVASILLLTAARLAQAAEPEKGSEKNSSLQMIETFFLSACQRAADPSSRSYYLEMMESGRQTPADVQKAIRMSCAPRQALERCEQVKGLDDLCGRRTQ